MDDDKNNIKNCFVKGQAGLAPTIIDMNNLNKWVFLIRKVGFDNHKGDDGKRTGVAQAEKTGGSSPLFPNARATALGT